MKSAFEFCWHEIIDCEIDLSAACHDSATGILDAAVSMALGGGLTTLDIFWM